MTSNISADEVFEYTGEGQSIPKDVVSVRFHPDVIEVNDTTFFDCKDLEKVVLNEGLQRIGRFAFHNCTSLESISCPSTLIEIGYKAFEYCNRLKKVVLNDGLKEIWENAFDSCSALVTISLPSTVTYISNGAFQYCVNLREVKLHEGLQAIGDSAFACCIALVTVSLPSTVTHISDYSFKDCRNLREVFIHSERLQIERCSFTRCIRLLFKYPSISNRLSKIIQTGHYPRVEAKIDEVRGTVERRGSDLFVSVATMAEVVIGVQQSLDQIIKLISYYEIKEATTLFELALWKSNLDQAEAANDINRDVNRIEVPGPVKDTILQYLS